MTALPLLALVLSQPDPAPPWVLPLVVSAAPAPVPALRYELLPVRDRQPGNAAVHYLRAAVARPAGPKDPASARELAAKLDRWDAGRVDDLPVEQVKAFLKDHRDALAELDAAARCDRCDWQLGRRLTPEDVGLLLPSVQAERELIRVQGLRARVALAEKRFDDAAAALRTGFQTAQHVGQGPSGIQLVVGVALAQVMLARAEDFVSRPDAPNLYWALAALPRPFLDPRPMLAGEASFQLGFIAGLDELERGPVSDDRARQIFDAAIDAVTRPLDADQRASFGLTDLLDKAARGAFLAVHAPAARKELVARGRPEPATKALPDAQAVLLRAVAYHREQYDEQAKLFFAPYPFAHAELRRLEKAAADKRKDGRTDPAIRLLAVGFPALTKIHFAHARLDRRLALLRAAEAVRLHRATSGKLPETLADTSVPVPDDPFTRKPFGYTVEGTTFTLTAPAIDAGQEATQAHGYKVTVR